MSRERSEQREAADNFSFGRLVARSLGAAAAVLVIAVPLVWWAAQEFATLALGIAIGAVIVMVIVMAVVARREMRHVQAEIDRLKDKRQDK